MKLGIIMDRYDNPYAGTESQVLKLVEGLKASGWQIRFAVFRSTDYSLSDEFPVPVEHLGVQSLSNPWSWMKVYQYARALRAEGYTLVHGFFNDASVICPPMMRLAGVRTVISRRDMGFWYTSTYLRALRQTGRWVNAVICNSRAVAAITSEMEGIEPARVHVIYNGYPESPPPMDVSRLPADEGRPVVIGIVANLRPIKRIHDLIDAAANLISDGHQIELRVVGGGDPSPYLAQVRNLGIESSVSLLGSQPDPERHIRAFDIAVLCSETEGFSNALIEYMRCGKPVVCTETGGNPEIVEDRVTGYLVSVGDVPELTKHLAMLVNDPVLRERMGLASYAQVQNRYSIDTMLNQHIELYSRISPRRESA